MSFLRATILDADGRRVPLVPHDMRLAFNRDSERSRRLHAASRMPNPPVTRGEVRRGIGYGLLALPVMAAAALAPAYMAFKMQLPWWGMALMVIPLGLLPGSVTVVLARRIAGARIARWYVGAGYCASCGYDLKATAAEDDGRRRCSECGACWRDVKVYPGSPSPG